MTKFSRRDSFLYMLGFPFVLIPKSESKKTVMYHGANGGMVVSESYQRIFDTIDNHSDLLSEIVNERRV